MKQYFVYILLCSDDSYYTGITSDLDRKVWEHENCFYPNAYTSTRLPVKLVFWEKFQTPRHAIEFEKQVKGWSRKKKQAIISGEWEKLRELAACMNKSHYANYNPSASPDSASPFDSAQGDA